MSHILQSMPQVAVLLPMSVKVSRDMRRGVLQYVRQCGPWGLHIIEGREGEQKLVRMNEWGCTGIIGRLYTPELVDVAAHAKVPQVLVDPEKRQLAKSHPIHRHSIMRSDTVTVGRMAAAYFLERRFVHYAYVGEVQGCMWSVRRGEAFARAVREAGFECQIYGKLTASEREDAGLERPRLCAWLRALPKPVALLAAMDNRGRQIIDACAWAGINVPQDIAVLGVDNDEDLCETATPAMSSILLDTERASYEAARHLDSMMRGVTRERRIIIYGPLQVISRRSTDTTQISDIVVVKALEFIAVNACAGIGVPEVVRHAGASRRLVEQRFRVQLGRTILDEIHRVRMERVCTMLRETNQTISDIAHQSGFDSESHLSNLFRREHGCTMRDFRKRK